MGGLNDRHKRVRMGAPELKVIETTALKGVQTAERVLKLLQVLVRSDRPVTVGDLSRICGENTHAIYRLIRMLEAQAFAARSRDKPGYVAGGNLIALAATVMRRINVREIARPFMERIRDVTLETTSLHVAQSYMRIAIDAVEGKHPVRRVVELGEALPLYASPAGKVILAFSSAREVKEVLDIARRDGKDAEMIEAHLHTIRRSGYMATIGDRTPGLGALAVPILSSLGVIAAITVSGPANRWSLEAMEDCREAVTQQCAMLSATLGGTDDPETLPAAKKS